MNITNIKNNAQYFKLKLDILEYKLGLIYKIKCKLMNNIIKTTGNL